MLRCACQQSGGSRSRESWNSSSRLRLGQIVEATADMAPTKCQRHGGLCSLGIDERLVGLIAIALQDTAIAAEQRRGMAGRCLGGLCDPIQAFGSRWPGIWRRGCRCNQVALAQLNQAKSIFDYLIGQGTRTVFS